MMDKPNAPSCERNQQVILDVLKDIIKPTDTHLLEIGSGTGQHAVFMAPHFPRVQWHTSDLPDNHAGINMWLDEAKLGNVSVPINYQAGKTQFLILMLMLFLLPILYTLCHGKMYNN